MGAFGISLGTLREELGELVGIRTGLAWSEARLDQFIFAAFPSLANGAYGTRMRAEEFKWLAFAVLRAAGDPWASLGALPRVSLMATIGLHRYRLAANLLHQEIHHQELGPPGSGHTASADCTSFGPHPDNPYFVAALDDSFITSHGLRNLDEQLFLGRVMMGNGPQARSDCLIMFNTYCAERYLDPWGQVDRAHGDDLLGLNDLFDRSGSTRPSGTFIDQRFIDYLYANLDDIAQIHWRQFERLVAEYLRRQGYFVELGPGRNDDGVDIRMWPAEPQSGQAPLVIVQCKRQRAKIEKVLVKALWADVQANSAGRGLVATTSMLSPGAASTIVARGYGIDVADHDAIGLWLEAMRTPGAGPDIYHD
jgi:hypothetical protein